MNSSTGNGLVEMPQSGPPEYRLPAAMVADEPDSSTQANLLAIAWRSRWLILLCLLLGGAVAWAALQRATPRYTSASQILVERSLPKMVGADFAMGTSGNFLNTQAEIIRSTSVLAAAAEQPEVRELRAIREADNPVGLLRQVVQVSIGQDNDIITISAELSDANDAAQVVNAVVDSYITKYSEDRRTDVVDVLNILRNEKIRRDDELAAARQRLDDFRRENVALSVQTSDGNVVTQRFGMLSSELNQTEIELLQSKARYNRVKKMYDQPSQRPFLLEMATADSQFLRGENLESQISDLEQQLAAELTRWGEGYPRVKLLNASLADLRERRDKQQANIVEAYVDAQRQEADLLQHKRDELKAAYDEQFGLATEVSSQTVALEGLRDELTRAESASDLVDEQIKQLNLSEEAVAARNVSIMEVATPGFQSYPEQSKFLGLGVVLGGLIGFGLAWLRDLLDHRLRSIDEIAQAVQLPIVGTLPLLVAEKTRAAAGRIIATRPRSSAAESVRTLRTGVHFGLSGEQTKIVVVTSPSPGDGKSIVASNLAIAMAQMGQRVLLIDADMRKPTQCEIFSATNKHGLASVLAERRPPLEAVVNTETPNLDLLPCGKLPPNPAELLNNGYFAEMLAGLLEHYDRVIVDSPPVMPVADARVIATMGHCTLLVLRAEHATRRMSVAARDELWKVRATRIGVVVNGVPPRKLDYGYGHGNAYDGYGGYGSDDQIAYGYNDDEIAARNDSTETSGDASPRQLTRTTK